MTNRMKEKSTGVHNNILNKYTYMCTNKYVCICLKKNRRIYLPRKYGYNGSTKHHKQSIFVEAVLFCDFQNNYYSIVFFSYYIFCLQIHKYVFHFSILNTLQYIQNTNLNKVSAENIMLGFEMAMFRIHIKKPPRIYGFGQMD